VYKAAHERRQFLSTIDPQLERSSPELHGTAI